MKFHSSSLFLPAVLVAATLGVVPAAQAQSVLWGTTPTNPSSLLLSNGSSQPLDFTWQLGWFDDGFTPSASNYLDWSDSWNAVDTENLTLDSGFTYIDGNANPLPASSYGKQAYVFAFNDIGLIGAAGGEALLYRRDGLTFPSDPFGLPPNLLIENVAGTQDDNFTVIWGRVDRDLSSGAGVITGGGIFTGTGNFEAQTAAFVPEPTSALLGLLGSALALVRRRKKA